MALLVGHEFQALRDPIERDELLKSAFSAFRTLLSFPQMADDLQNRGGLGELVEQLRERVTTSANRAARVCLAFPFKNTLAA